MVTLTYGEAFRVAWPLMWRGGLLAGIISLVVNFIGAFIGTDPASTNAWNLFFLTTIGTALYPIFVRKLFLLRFRGFHLAVVRDSPVATGNPAGLPTNIG